MGTWTRPTVGSAGDADIGSLAEDRSEPRARLQKMLWELEEEGSEAT